MAKEFPDKHKQYAEVLAGQIIYALSEEAKVSCLAGLTDGQMFRVQRCIEDVLIQEVHERERV